MSEPIYEIQKTYYSFNSCTSTSYRGTVKQLVSELKGYLQGKKPRTIKGLMTALNNYSQKHQTTYTYTSFVYKYWDN